MMIEIVEVIRRSEQETTVKANVNIDELHTILNRCTEEDFWNTP